MKQSEINHFEHQLRALKTQTMASLDHALFRIDAGDFGECEECGEAVSSKRLKTVPYARKCLTCSEDERVL